MDKGSRIKDEIKGLLAIIAGLVITISIVSHKKLDDSILTYSNKNNNLLGSFGANLSDILIQAIGYSAYIIPVVFFFYGLKKIFGKSQETRLPIYIGAAVMLIFSASSLITLIFGSHSGGLVGTFSTGPSLKIISTTGSYLLFITMLLISIMYLFNFSIAAFIKKIRKNISQSSQAISTLNAKRRELSRIVETLLMPEQRQMLDALFVAGKMGKLNAIDFSFDLTNRYNIWAGVIGGLPGLFRIFVLLC